MSRPLRIEYMKAFYHVMNRGAGFKSIFENDTHRELFLELLAESHAQYGIQIHAYCLMTNHYQTLFPNLSRAMRHINGQYTQRYNRLNRTDGPLFRGRYKAIVVDSIWYSKKGRGCENTPRKMAMYIAHKKYDYLLTEIATALQLKHYGGVANAISTLTIKFKEMPEVLGKMNAIINRLDS